MRVQQAWDLRDLDKSWPGTLQHFAWHYTRGEHIAAWLLSASTPRVPACRLRTATTKISPFHYKVGIAMLVLPPLARSGYGQADLDAYAA